MFSRYLKLFAVTVDSLTMWVGKLAALLMPILAFVVVFEVLSRYLLNSPTIWAYDLSLFLFGYIAALGGAYAQQKRAHINVDMLYSFVSPRVKSYFNVITFTLGIFFLLVVIYTSLGKFNEAIEFNYRRQSEWAPPMWHFWLMLIVSSALFIMQLFKDMLLEIYFLATAKRLFEGETNCGN